MHPTLAAGVRRQVEGGSAARQGAPHDICGVVLRRAVARRVDVGRGHVPVSCRLLALRSRIAVTIALLQLLMRCARYSEGVVYKGEMMRDMRHGTGAR